MAVVHAYPFSALAMHRRAMGERFTLKYPHAWLIWEPVPWKPSPSPKAETLPVDPGKKPKRPVGGDALCFELLAGEPLKLGRAADSDLRLNDVGVSRDHLRLLPEGATGWRLVPFPSGRTFVGDQQLTLEGLTLRPGDELRLGNILLTFLDVAGMAQRLDGAVTSAQQQA